MDTLDTLLAHFAASQPNAPFVVEAEGGATLTYAACQRAVLQLRAALGPTPRTIVLALPGGNPAAVVWLAALTGGHRLVPCAPESAPEERARLASAQRPDVLVVARPADAAPFASPAARVLLASEITHLALDTAPGDMPADAPAAREGELRLTTSGTTGEPKGVVLAARQILWTAEHVRDSHHLTPADRGLSVLPFFHINAPVVSLCATLTAGGAVIVAPRFSRRQFWAWVARERITWVSIVPTIVALLLTDERPVRVPASLRFARTASAPLPVAHLRAFEQRFGVPVIETYGLSEAASQVAANPVPPGERRPGSVGKPQGVRVRICAPPGSTGEMALREVAPGALGEICLRGPSIIAGYEGGAGAGAFRDGWFRTGDLGYLDGDGYLYIAGRLRDVINRGGEKVAPREIEEVLLDNDDVADVAVGGEPDPIYGQRVVAYIVPRGVWSTATPERLRAYCATRLSAYKVPEVFYAVEELPRNRTGKLARQQLPNIMLLPTTPAPAAARLARHTARAGRWAASEQAAINGSAGWRPISRASAGGSRTNG